MAKKTSPTIPTVEEQSFETLMETLYSKFAKYVIQDRALPDVRDGLKPVQRRILYAMHEDKNDHSKPYRKSAKTVGSVIANFHPHGDSSVYDAMVRMSQSWKMGYPLVDMQGNNGSIDNDPPAAMRYTEARLSKIASLLLEDLGKNTVNMSLNFDDSALEPTVFPARFPNLLVNGSVGIASGYATSIPPHPLDEVVKACDYRLKNPTCSLEEICDILKGPDFPTGGIVEGKSGLIQAYKTGKGECIVKGKTHLEEGKNELLLVIDEIPYGIDKSRLVVDITSIKLDDKIDGISDVRDESGRDGIRIVVEIKKDIDPDIVLNYIYKNTPLQTICRFNMVAIVDRKPVQLGLLALLDSYIAHQYEIKTRRCQYELDKANNRLEIVIGLVKAVSILDEVISLIRSSKNRADAKTNLIEKFNFSNNQAEAILSLQLYRLTSTDIIELEKEKASLEKTILTLEGVLKSHTKMTNLISKELLESSTPFFIPRRTIIREEITTIAISEKDLVVKEDVMISLTKDGYAKRSSLRSFSQSNDPRPGLKTGDNIVIATKAHSLDCILVFTDSGNFFNVDVYRLEDNKWKDEGKHLSQLVTISGNEKIVSAYLIQQYTEDVNVIIASRCGLIKRTSLDKFSSKISRPSRCMNLSEGDSVIGAKLSDGDGQVYVASSSGVISKFNENDITLTNIRTQGVKSINVSRWGEVVCLEINNHQTSSSLVIITAEGGVKVVNDYHIPLTSRLASPTPLYKAFKSDPHTLVWIGLEENLPPLYLTCSDLSSLVLELEKEKPVELNRVIRSSITLPQQVKITGVSDGRTVKIDEQFQTYSPTKVVEKVKVEKKSFEGQVSIFDLLDE